MDGLKRGQLALELRVDDVFQNTSLVATLVADQDFALYI